MLVERGAPLSVPNSQIIRDDAASRVYIEAWKRKYDEAYDNIARLQASIPAPHDGEAPGCNGGADKDAHEHDEDICHDVCDAAEGQEVGEGVTDGAEEGSACASRPEAGTRAGKLCTGCKPSPLVR